MRMLDQGRRVARLSVRVNECVCVCVCARESVCVCECLSVMQVHTVRMLDEGRRVACRARARCLTYHLLLLLYYSQA